MPFIFCSESVKKTERSGRSAMSDNGEVSELGGL